MARIDYFSLEVEGAELQVLQTMPWEIPVCLWTVELKPDDARRNADIRDLLNKHGYKEVFALDDNKSVFQSEDLNACGARVTSSWWHVGLWLILVALVVAPFLLRHSLKTLCVHLIRKLLRRHLFPVTSAESPVTSAESKLELHVFGKPLE